jgi:hypothetical protein
LLGGKWEEVKRCFSFSFHWPPSIRAFHWPPRIRTFQGPPNNGTFQGPLSWDLPSTPSFSFSLKGKFGSFGVLFFWHNFRLKSWKYLFSQPSLGGEEWLLFEDGGKKESKLDVCNIFERVEVSRDNVGSLKF